MRRFSNLGLGTLFAVGLFMTASPAFAQNDIRHDRHDIRHDRRDLHSDRQNIHNQRVDLHNDYQTLRQNRTTLRNDVKNGASTDQIKAITGHRSLSEVQRYTRAADQQRLARQALQVQLGAEREQDLSNLEPRLDKTDTK